MNTNKWNEKYCFFSTTHEDDCAQLTFSLYKNMAQEKDVWLYRDQQGLAAQTFSNTSLVYL